MANDSFPAVRRLGADDLSRCVALSVDRAWSAERSKWAMLLDASEAFGVDAPDRRGLAGAVVLTRWGPDLASIGMMLVALRYGRRGLGRALMEHALAEAGGATVTLFATDLGRPLYQKLGFQPVRRNVAFVGDFRPDRADARPARAADWAADAPPASVRTATDADRPAILALDRAAFGADRSAILTRLPAFADRIAVLVGPSGHAGPSADADLARDGITGYAAAWRSTPASTVIGPVVAPDPQAAERLITDLAAHAHGTIRLDLDPDRRELPAWAHKHGLEPVGRTLVMARGDLPDRGNPASLFTPISVALA